MKRQNFYSLALKASAVAVLLGSVSSEMNAQDLVNSANGKIKNTGTIRFKKDGAKFTNNSTAAVATAHSMDSSTAVVEFLGATAVFDGTNAFGSDATTNRFPGLVRWNGTAAQDLDARVGASEYYTNLELAAGGTKAIPDAVYVGGTYNVVALTGARSYTGTFYYDGADQKIFAENGASGTTDQYNNLDLQGTGLKSLVVGDATVLKGTFKNIATAPLTIGGALTFGGIATVDGVITIDSADAASLTTSGTALALASFGANLNVNQGVFNVEAGGATFGSTATLALASVAATEDKAILNVDAATDLTITGTFTNGYAAATNMNYNASSNTIYNGATSQEIVATVGTHPYGNLTTDNSGKTVAGDVYIAGDLGVNDGDLDVLTGDHELFMTDGGASYGAGGFEVRGKMTRDGSFTETTTLLATGTPYTYNNAKTIVQFTGGTTMPESFSVDARSATNPLQYDNTKDVNRKIVLSYAANSTDWVATVQAGYKPSDIPGTWAGGASQSTLRYMEADASEIEKLATGNPYTRDTTDADMRSVSLAGIMPTTDNVDGISDKFFKSTNDLVLRGGPTVFNAVAHGRWSNPATWDEGEQPGALDVAVINGYTVHAGYPRLTDNNFADPELHPEALASAVYVGSMSTANTAAPNTGLLFGSTGALNTFGMSANTTITNRAGTAITTNLNTQDTANSQIEGLIIYAGSTLKTDDLLNEGQIGNGGNLEIGD